MVTTLHITPGDSAGGSLKQALNLKDNELLAWQDCLDGGPILDFNSLSEWRELRRPHLNDCYSFPVDSILRSIQYDPENPIQVLQNADEIILWVGASCREQLFISWIIRLFQNNAIELNKLKLVETYQVKSLKGNKPQQILGVGELHPEQLQESFNPRSLCAEEVEILELAWNAVTASSPDTLLSFTSNSSTYFPHLYTGLQRFLARYPCRKTGLSSHELHLLKFCKEQAPKVVRAIGYTMAESYDHLDPVGDGYLFWRLKKLADNPLPHPALMLTGNLDNMRETEVCVTEIGEQVLNGKTNFVELNGIDDWVGGVHLSSDNNCIWFYENDTLVSA